MRVRALCATLILAGCGGGGSAGRGPVPAGLPTTRAENTKTLETSHYEDVIAFLDSLERTGVPMYRTVLGTSPEGRAIPLVVLSRPQVKSPAAARALHRPVVYVQANIHAGEVEGKEALLALIRNLAVLPSPNVLDSIVLVAVPIYNADGNEKFASQAVNRTEQNGPESVGQRANGQGLDLNRDYVKGEAPETRASLTAIATWGADVFVDLHTTDGSFHGYALTYAPSLNPAAVFGGTYARDSILPVLRVKMREKYRYPTYDYGNFSFAYGEDINTDTVKKGWYTYDARPRFGTNYVGLRGRIAILAEGYSHDPFDRRIASMYYFVREILSYAATHRRSILASSERADSSVTAWGASPGGSPPLALRSALASSPNEDSVVSEDLIRTGDSALTQPGVPRGLARSGHYRTQLMPVYVTFEATLRRRLPFAYAIPASDTAAIRVLGLHGVRSGVLKHAAPVAAQLFIVDSVGHAERPFQGHHETSITGRWIDSTVTLVPGTVIVRASQPLGVVAFYLLEPESDDGLVTWNFFDPSLAPGRPFPVIRVPGGVAGLKDAE